MDGGVSEDSLSLVETVMRAVRRRIAARTLAPGAKLPSIRAMATEMGVSKSTVVEAYDRLAAESVIRSRRGSGFFVAGHLPPLALAEIGPKLDRAIDPLWVSRQVLEAGEGVMMPGCGWLPDTWLASDELRRAMRNVARNIDSARLTRYDMPLGLAPLRRLLARRQAEHGIEVSPDQIILTDSATQAIDLLCRFLLEPGDTVLVDDPCYFNFHALLKAHRVRVISVPYTPSGPDVAAFAAALSEHRPRLYLTNVALHNPTGATIAPAVAHRILRLAEQHDLTIIEDEVFADLEPEPSPRLAAFDGLERVVQVGSFSKALTAAARCGYIVARKDWIEPLIDLKIAVSYGGSRLPAELTLAVMTDGSYRHHLDRLRERLSRAMGEATARLKALGIEPWTMPRGGMLIWCRLPEGVDAADLARRALQRDIVLAPGNAFSLSQSAAQYMRFNVAQCADPRLFDLLSRLLGS
ncbi:MAG TPA: PLP-dependent aminotransferase family protein [Magnetospirillaceae bacterium]|nr:PLP-dependent aminotransferase family protein [Magnetospirillaceae bacterium]